MERQFAFCWRMAAMLRNRTMQVDQRECCLSVIVKCCLMDLGSQWQFLKLDKIGSVVQKASQSSVCVVMWSIGELRDRDAYYIRTLARMMECCLPIIIQCCVLCPSDKFLETLMSLGHILQQVGLVDLSEVIEVFLTALLQSCMQTLICDVGSCTGCSYY